MPQYVKDGKKVFFIHIPKTGGSSLEKMFVDNGWEELEYGSIGKSQQHDRRYIWSQNVSEDVEKITIIRNPVDRLLSEMRGAPDYRERVNPWNANAVIDYFFQLINQGNFKAGHLSKIVEFVDPETMKDDNITIYRFEDLEHRNKLTERFGFEGSYPHVVGGGYEPDLDYSLSEESIEKILDYYKEDFEHFYPELLK